VADGTSFCATLQLCSLMVSNLFIDTVVDVVNVAVKSMNFQCAIQTLSMTVQGQLNVSPPAEYENK